MPGQDCVKSNTALKIERRGRVVILENQHPPHNRMTLEYMDELERAVTSLQDDREVRAVATMFGYCLGGGLELPLACHFRLAASEGARIGLPELDLGTVPAWGGTARLTRTVGRAHAFDLAEELAAQPPLAVAGVLRAVVGAEHLPLDEALRIEREAVRLCSGTADQIEGMKAFIEKRRPNFQGR
jgi:enoyl-CoA hydratase/carnithine racemase